MATVCRFLVAYVSMDGLDAIGRHLLSRALRDPRSFGVASLTCSCGFDPLIRLQRDVPEVRLKYFMDPIVREPGEPRDITLFHSKLVYLLLEAENKSVVYIGSHNWTRRALGPGGSRNAEASMRFELDYEPADLDGNGTSIASHVNRHLLDAWNMPLCLPATVQNETTFQEWFARGCQNASPSPLQQTTIILAVRKGTAPVGPDEWLALEQRGMYFQVLEEDAGQIVWRSNDRLLVLVWESEAALRSSEQPIILNCRITTNKAGLDSQLRGTNQSSAPIAGFMAVIWDEAECTARQSGSQGRRVPVPISTGRQVDIYDFEFPTSRANSSQVDGSIRPLYQFHLEVEHVAFPVSGNRPKRPHLSWSPESFAVAEDKKSARMEESPGFYVEPRVQQEMLSSLTQILGVDLNKAKVLPFSHIDRFKIGKRISEHPLHETYIRDRAERRDEFYEKTKPGALVAEIDENLDTAARTAKAFPKNVPLARTQCVFTMPLTDLMESWKANPEHS